MMSCKATVTILLNEEEEYYDDELQSDSDGDTGTHLSANLASAHLGTSQAEVMAASTAAAQHSDKTELDDVCAICLDDLACAPIYTTPCNHQFHNELRMLGGLAHAWIHMSALRE